MLNNIKKKLPDKTKIMVKRRFRNTVSYLFQFNLTKLAKIFKTDKWGRHYYTRHYQKHLKKYKFMRINLLEIGVGGYKYPNAGGNSLRMWKKYFPFGNIYSIDIYDKRNLQEKRIKIYQGSQIDKNFLLEMINESGKFDIIIDDGSHINEHVVTSFEILFPFLKSGGTYIIEDLETSYNNSFGGDAKNLNNKNTSMNFFKTFPDRINRKEFNIPEFEVKQYEKDISGIHFYHNLIIIDKVVDFNK